MDPRIDQITQYLDKIAMKLGLRAAEIWPWLIKQQYIEPIPFYVCGFLGVVTSYFAIKKANAMEEAGADGDNTFVVFIAGIILAIVGTVLIGVGSHEVWQLLNVEYAAMKDLLSLIGG